MAQSPRPVASPAGTSVNDLRDASTLPYAWYVDPGKFALEHARIFSRTWQYVGHVGRVASPGDFFTTPRRAAGRRHTRRRGAPPRAP
jgi:hypothetical protein